MTRTLQISVEISKYRLASEDVAQAYPLIDEETLRNSLEEITDLHEMIAAAIRSALVDEALRSRASALGSTT